jgi:hypothetical protein
MLVEGRRNVDRRAFMEGPAAGVTGGMVRAINTKGKTSRVRIIAATPNHSAI